MRQALTYEARLEAYLTHADSVRTLEADLERFGGITGGAVPIPTPRVLDPGERSVTRLASRPPRPRPRPRPRQQALASALATLDYYPWRWRPTPIPPPRNYGLVEAKLARLFADFIEKLGAPDPEYEEALRLLREPMPGFYDFIEKLKEEPTSTP